MAELEECVVTELGKCGEPTPANIIQALFEFVRRSTPCSKFQNAKLGNSSAISLQSAISLVALSCLTLILGRISYK